MDYIFFVLFAAFCAALFVLKAWLFKRLLCVVCHEEQREVAKMCGGCWLDYERMMESEHTQEWEAELWRNGGYWNT